MSFQTCNDLKKEIHLKLDGLIEEKCVLLNTPDHINIGDQLIWQGEMDFLRSKGITPFYITSSFNFDWRELSDDTQILLHGGGNFGDIWEFYQDFRLQIIKKYRKNKIFIFPQSVEYNNKEKMRHDAAIFSSHKNLVICARDIFSYELLKENFDNTILLVPDMAFCSDYARLRNETEKTLLLKRKDREIQRNIDYDQFKEFDIRDWPSFDNSIFNFIHRVHEKLNRMFACYFVKNKNGDTTFGFGVLRDKEYLINKGVEFISEYDLVITTRLHGHILSLLLGIPSIMIDNNYGKNSRFYNTWLKDFQNSSIVSNNEELVQKIKEFETRTK